MSESAEVAVEVEDQPQEEEVGSENQVIEEQDEEVPKVDKVSEEDNIEKEPEETEEDRVREEPEETTMQLLVGNISQGAIEDEEMPSMVSISSVSKVDDSESYIKQDEESKVIAEENEKPNTKIDEDDDSDVCVIESDDEEEEPDGSSYDDEEETSSYHDDDSVEMCRRNQHENQDRRQGRNVRRADDEDRRVFVRRIENEDDEEEDEEDEDEDEDLDDDFEMDYFGGGSDDIVLKHSNGLVKEDKERSASLQDLSRIKERFSKNRHSVNPYSQKVRQERNEGNQKYAHVESKVKKYIMNLTEQRRISGEIRRKAQEEARRSQEPPDLNREEITITCKNIKSYAEKGLKEVAECEENEGMYIVPHGTENGEISIFPRRSIDNGDSRKQSKIDSSEFDSRKNDERIDKINGIALNENQNNYISERKGILRREEYSLKPILNGEDPTNGRTLTYEEYMKGSIKEVISENAYEVQAVSEKCNNNTEESPCIIQIESVKSTFQEETMDQDFHDRKTPPTINNQMAETYYQDSGELDSLRIELQQRNTQFEHLRDAYQKTISENMAMKMELQNLKQMLSYYQQQPQKPISETKAVAVQTEEVPAAPLNMPLIDIDNDDNDQQIDPKLATTSMTSAMSSQWSDSIGSAALSMEQPPNVTSLLSDESTNQQVKARKNALSRAFLTSSKILQTLANITHGKSKLDKSKRSKTPPANSDEAGTSSQVGSSNPKKRKATDTMEISSAAQPFKIPHLSKPDSEKDKKTEDSPGPRFVNPNLENEFKSAHPDENEDDDDEVQEIEENVKVFVYPDDDGSKEQSFLIQAKEITDNPKPGVRECGPYLLGNVEVYMTEMNGTINIWGKELSQSSASQINIEDLDVSAKSKDLRSDFRWQSTPRIFNNQGSASTSKKSKVLPRFTQNSQHSCEMNNTVLDCENSCSHNHRLSWPSCNHSGHEIPHSCCHQNVRVEDIHCGCGHPIDRRFTACCKSHNFFDAKRFSLPNVYHQNQSPCCNNHHSHCKNPAQEELHRHQTIFRRQSFNPTDEDEDDDDVLVMEENTGNVSKLNSSQQENSPHSSSTNKLVPPCSNSKKSVDINSTDRSYQNESDPLIFQKPTPETSEGRKRRLSGKRVRGILLDLIKGCGDCRTSNPINKTSNMQHTASIYEPSTSSQHRSCPCSQRSEKCSLCRTRNDKTAELEAQLEYFQNEMEKLRSHSDLLQNMVEKIRKEDVIN